MHLLHSQIYEEYLVKMPVKTILGTIPISMSARLAARNLRKKKKAEEFIEEAMEDIVGISLIRETAKFIDF